MRCEVQGCKAEAQRMLRMPKVQVCEIHYVLNQKARQRMARIRYYWNLRGGYSRFQGMRRGKYYYVDARKKKDLT